MKSRIYWILAGMLIFIPISYSQNYQQVTRLFENPVAEYKGFGKNVAISGNFAIVGSQIEDKDAFGNNILSGAGAAYIYERETDGNWNFVQKLLASDRAVDDFFGESVAISGNYAVIGATWEDEDSLGFNTINRAGSAYVFERQPNGVWMEVDKIVAKDRTEDDRFGGMVKIFGRYIMVGVPLSMDMDGAAFVYFRNDDGKWLQIQKLVSNDQQILESFGASIALSEQYAVIGAPGEDNDGACFIYKLNGDGKWDYLQTIHPTPSDVSLDRFGSSIAISNNYLVVGSNYDQDDEAGISELYAAGSAYIFECFNNNWIQVKKLIAPDRLERDNFGSSVAIAGDNIIVGSWGDLDETGENPIDMAGAAYFYHRNNLGEWSFIDKTVSEERNQAGLYGYSINMSGQYAIVGSYNEDYENLNDTIENAGSVYFFEIDQSSGLSDDFKNQFSLYPNPADQYVIIHTTPGSHASLYNCLGTRVKETDIKCEDDLLELKELPSGVYLLEVTIGIDRVCRKLMIR